MYQKFRRAMGKCKDCGKDIEIKGNRERCTKCSHKRLRIQTNESNKRRALRLKLSKGLK